MKRRKRGSSLGLPTKRGNPELCSGKDMHPPWTIIQWFVTLYYLYTIPDPSQSHPPSPGAGLGWKNLTRTAGQGNLIPTLNACWGKIRFTILILPGLRFRTYWVHWVPFVEPLTSSVHLRRYIYIYIHTPKRVPPCSKRDFMDGYPSPY